MVSTASVMKDEQGRPFIVVREYVVPMSTLALDQPHLAIPVCDLWERMLTFLYLVKERRNDNTATMQSSPILLQQGQSQTLSEHLW